MDRTMSETASETQEPVELRKARDAAYRRKIALDFALASFDDCAVERTKDLVEAAKEFEKYLKG